MNKEEIAEIFKYCSPNSLVVVTYYNKLKELYCPFPVKVKADIGELKRGIIVKVEAVKLSTNGKTVFIVDGKAYYYFHFDILIVSV